MCGIIGYVGRRPCKDLLLQGLERLEYRGYDSAGLALREDERLDYMRAVGNLQVLKQAAGPNGSQATTGLGHTRWATHGAVTMQNAHPLSGCDDGELAIVLNGIVENFRELKESLEADGHTFKTETDAEVVVHLIERHYDGDLAEAVRAAYRELEGHFAFVAVHHDHPDELVGARLQCPLLVGVGQGEMFLASMAAAFISENRRRERRGRARDGRGRLGPRGGREERLRDLHAQGDLRPARGCGRDARRPRAAREAGAREPGHDRDRAVQPAPDRDRRGRHLLPRGRRRPLHDRGVGAPAGRARHRQ